jgi:hypothetical protein
MHLSLAAAGSTLLFITNQNNTINDYSLGFSFIGLRLAQPRLATTAAAAHRTGSSYYRSLLLVIMMMIIINHNNDY